MAEINFEKAYYDLKGKYDIALKIIDNQKKLEENNQKIINALRETISLQDKQIESKNKVIKAADDVIQYFDKKFNKTEAR